MIRVDETDPVGEIEPSFPYRAVTVRKGVQFNDTYEIESEIGRGKFGTVYRCKEKKSVLALAAKVVNTSRKEDKRAVEREVEIMRRLQHPRLIQLYDAIDTGKQIYVILELIQGGELFERVIDDDFLLTERSCAVFMRQICEGIEFIHGQHILHLDMKPENILCLTKEGNRIKIIDFGLAREYDPKKKLQVLFGTPEFVAPEVVNFDQIGFGTDMWSIGVICYVLLSGLSPFMGDTDIETMANVTIAKYDFDDEAFSGISEDAKDFIRSLLVKDISKRASASQCRQHRWLGKKTISSSAVNGPKPEKPKINGLPMSKQELDVTKDNLRLFVERWREHPNSPYTIEVQTLIEVASGINEKNLETISLCCHSPSSCESLSSSISGSTNSTRDHGSGSFLAIPNFGLSLERRASEGAKARDAAAQILLAEEIIKLSEHLRLIAMGCDEPESGKKAEASFEAVKKTNEKMKTVDEKKKSEEGEKKTKGKSKLETKSKVETNAKEEIKRKESKAVENGKEEMKNKLNREAKKKVETNGKEEMKKKETKSVENGKEEMKKKETKSVENDKEEMKNKLNREEKKKVETSSKVDTNKEMKTIDTNEVKTIDTNEVKTIDTNEVKAIDTNEVKRLETNDLKKLETNKVRKLETNQVKKLETNQVKKLETNKIKTLETNQVKKLETNQVKNLEPNEVKRVETNLLKKLETNKIKTLETNQVKKLKPNEVKRLETNQVKKSEPNEVKRLETNQVKKSEPNEVNRLETNQVKKLETNEVNKLETNSKTDPKIKPDLMKSISEKKFGEEETNEISEKLSNIARQRKINGTTFNGNRFDKFGDSGSGNFTLKKTNKFNTVVFNDCFSPKITDNFSVRPPFMKSGESSIDDDYEREMDLIPPWRKCRPKRRFSESCRDVPRITNLQDLHKTLNLNEPKSTKDLLLQLLTEWDEVRPTAIGRKSSVDWCGEESIARRSMNSLAEYFQSEQKKSATTSDPAPSIHR